MRFLRSALFVSGLALAAGGAAADPRLDEVVYTPFVENGIAEIELRNGTEVGAGSLSGATTSVIEAEAGLSDHVSLAVLDAVESGAGAPSRLDAIGVEVVAYLGQIPKIGVDVGAYFEVDQGLNGGQSEGEAKLLLAKTAGRFQGLVNVIVERPIAAPRGEGLAEYGYAASATWRTVGGFRLGGEAFGDLGDDRRFGGRQGAYVGPQLEWEGRPRCWPFELEVDAGWLAAVGADRREAASQARFAVELERRF